MDLGGCKKRLNERMSAVGFGYRVWEYMSTLSTDGFFDMHEKDYKVWMNEHNCPESSPLIALEYFNFRMFQRKDMRVESDKEYVSGLCIALHYYFLGGLQLRAYS
jgi:hypothetical protein